MKGEIVNGYWRYEKLLGNGMILFTNIYNGTEIEISERQFRNVKNGKDTIARIMTRRINNSGYMVSNNVVKTFRANKFRYHWLKNRGKFN